MNWLELRKQVYYPTNEPTLLSEWKTSWHLLTPIKQWMDDVLFVFQYSSCSF